MEVATGRTNLMTQLHHDPGHTSMIEDVVVDQFVLFYKALNYLEAALSLAHTRIKDGKLHQTNAVVKVVTSLNQKFCECLNAVKRLLKGGVGEVVKPMRISADELLYNYAVTLVRFFCNFFSWDEFNFVIFGSAHSLPLPNCRKNMKNASESTKKLTFYFTA